MIKKILLGSAISSSIILSACSATPAKTEPTPHLGMANPASVYCEKIGGKSVIQKGENGDIGYCHLSNGQVVEEWELFRKNHAQ